MNITGIITEYNPFHLGHKLHLQKAKEDTSCDAIICVMSGNFMQRGTPALIDKWRRAEMAVANGVDLVIELPLLYSISSAEGFAEGAVSILNQTGVVNSLYFGSEHGNLNDLEKISSTILYDRNDYNRILKEELNKGLPFHSARSKSLNRILGTSIIPEILSNSNNILAIEYLKALKKYNSDIKPFTLKRAGARYNEIELKSTFPSATSIRAALKSHNDLSLIKDTIPYESYNILKQLNSNKYCFTFPDEMFPYLKYKILTNGKFLKNIPEVSEGLDNKFIKEISNSSSLDELILNVKSKRYTYTRISRILTSFFIGLENYNIKEISQQENLYIRPLAFNSKGSKILKEIKNAEKIETITKIPKNINNRLLELDLLGTKAYSILNSSISPYDDYLKSPIYLK